MSNTARLVIPWDKNEMLTDSIGIIAADTLNKLDFNPGVHTLIGTALGQVIWQAKYKKVEEREVKIPSIASVIEGKVNVEDVAEQDLEYGALLKGGVYSMAIYVTDFLINGTQGANPLTDALIDGYLGGALGGYMLRQNTRL